MNILVGNSLILPGILLIPNSIAKSGLAWGVIQMLFCGWLGFYSLMLIVKNQQKSLSLNLIRLEAPKRLKFTLTKSWLR